MNSKLDEAIKHFKNARNLRRTPNLAFQVHWVSEMNRGLSLLESAKAEQLEPKPVEGAVLKPCPFCGAKAQLIKHGINRDRWIVECSRVECRYTYETALEAVNYWNATRPSDREIDHLTADLKTANEQVITSYERGIRDEQFHSHQDRAIEIDSLTAENAKLKEQLGAEGFRFREQKQISKAHAERIEKLEDSLRQIQTWAQAYPLDIFPKPDLKKSREVLEQAGLTLDAISADAMRHVLDGVTKIVEQALSKENP